MEVHYWDGGLQEQEVRAIEKIEKAFTANKENNLKSGKLKSFSDLKTLNEFPINSWKGYAGFRFIGSEGKEGEIDLLIVTHSRILIIELKDWNGGKIKCVRGNWLKGNKMMGGSPVSVTRRKVFLVKQKVDRINHELTNKGYSPFVEFFVVMTGTSKIDDLPDDERAHTLTLSEFLEFADEDIYNSKFTLKHSRQGLLHKDIKVFDELFAGAQVEPKPIVIDGWIEKEEIFNHPKGVYQEFRAVSESSNNEEALIRRWDFNKLATAASKTPDGRYKIVSRERGVLQFIKNHKLDLYNHCLTSLTIPVKEKITSQYNEVYELPPAHKRLNEFIGRYGVNLSIEDRVGIIKLLLSRFYDLHKMKVAHRDIGDHSVWISPGKEIALSNFISSYYEEIGTVGAERVGLSVVDAEAPLGMDVSNQTTPFQMDVYSLAIVAWHIIEGERLSNASIRDVKEQVEASESWYAPLILKALEGGSYKYAGDFLEEFLVAEPRQIKDAQFDLSKLEKYRKDIHHTREYRDVGDFIKDTSSKEIYPTGEGLLKAWLNVNPLSLAEGMARRIHYFLESIERLREISPEYIPKIKDFGIANKSSSLFLVSEYINAPNWSEVTLNEEGKIEAVNQLIKAVEGFHELGFSHGDLHPGNVLISPVGDLKVYLVDTPDFDLDTEESFSPKYAPENMVNSSAFERDIYAVIRMSSELLGLDWCEESERYPALSSAIRVEVEDQEFGFRDLSRFKDALEKPSLSGEASIETVKVVLKGDFDPVTLYPDNGQLYVKISKSKNNNEKQAFIEFHGVGGIFKCFFSKEEGLITNGLPPHQRGFVSKGDREDASLDLPFAISIEAGYSSDLSMLNEMLSGCESFQIALDGHFYSESEEAKTNVIIPRPDSDPNQSAKEDEVRITTRRLWKAIIETETESLPYLEVAHDVVQPKDNNMQIVVPYEAEKDALDSFKKGDDIEAIQIINDKDYKLGEVLLIKSTLKEVRLHKLRNRARHLSEGDIVFFRTKADKSSYEKRKNALERLLKDEAVINGLCNYFEPGSVLEPEEYGALLSESDFSRYDREDDYGNVISLNPKQRDAFQKIANFGPLSLLQGPPGTGKTEFIAAFVHYLVEKQGVKNILLVSQSHEAVNTAAERIRRHCMRLDTPLDVVRFSNREGAVSDGLKDVYSNSIVTAKRELFRAEIKHRIKSMSQPIGLDKKYLSALIEMELGIFSNIETLISINQQMSDDSRNESEIDELNRHVKSLEDAIIQSLLDFGYEDIDAINDIYSLKSRLLKKLEDEYAVRPNESVLAKALVKISHDMIDVLGTERVNYDEFLARSRQLVTGTCVGIGQRHIGISTNQYDWVIIDEAARSIASELAIAMQSGKRVLLVGDHKQLPPLYSEPHKKSLARKLGLATKGRDIDDLVASDFARAFNSSYGKRASAQLLTQYRMAPPIGDLVSGCFYDGELENGKRAIPDVYKTLPACISKYVNWIDTSVVGNRANHKSDRGSSIYNRYEADVVISLLKDLSSDAMFVASMAGLVKDGEAAIGVICMYAEQKRIIRTKFKEHAWSDDFKRLVKIDTVDSYQGKENRIIVLSVTRSCEDRSPGFLWSPNRINVALSRAMDRLVVVGDLNMWRGKNSDLPLGKVISFMECNNKDGDYGFFEASKLTSNGRGE
ncbi:MAG: AAA domain-containing protein [Pseudomonadota bacterium]|nr:AAA domain-containing protein [Pseudomonadota bacterium]MEE3320511.1 AAA domain-containing protein [Pseudomonadota bacterium]